MIKTWATYLVICLLLVTATALTLPRKPADNSAAIITAYLKNNLPAFTASAQKLQTAVEAVTINDTATLNHARQALIACRLQYKRVSFLLDYFFAHETTVFNNPPKYEVDEPDMEYQHPAGLQVIEQLLYDSAGLQTNKTALLQQATLVQQSAEAPPALLYQFNATGNQLMESARLELIRVMALYITGYDAPIAKSGVEEAATALAGIQEVLTPYLNNYAGKDSLQLYLAGSIQFLQSSKGFDGFDRLAFLTNNALPLQHQLQKAIQVLHLELNTVPALNVKALNLFSAGALDKEAFFNGEENNDTALVNLGRQLFFETGLSGDGSRSCASCHNPAKYFTDGLTRNTVLNSHTSLPRNTPTLLYSVYQYSQFWDGRAKSISQQAGIVMHNKDEMAANDGAVINRLVNKDSYVLAFTKIWPRENGAVTITHVTTALAAFVKTLAPFSSPFDRYMQGDHTALTAKQQQGFNIFMGKAACATCHFAPLFNGLTPPLYNKTEYEVAGTTASDDFTHPTLDTDSGRYNFFPIQFYLKAFKTPTVRNAAVTAPYMHNGALKTIQSVVEFYDKGGAAGLGLNEPNQTLPLQPLHLTSEEKECLIAFMEALTDKSVAGNR